MIYSEKLSPHFPAPFQIVSLTEAVTITSKAYAFINVHEYFIFQPSPRNYAYASASSFFPLGVSILVCRENCLFFFNGYTYSFLLWF